ncbi:hypothetical protein [Marinobacter sp. ELB17]|nr:hypothetical protein [Marinobacter sp. ELB17]EBA01354.1 hypothetical protein MELB17_01210 [Marinobacter sp. ELB17]
MPGMITGKKTKQYSTEFKSVKGVAEALDIHPFTLATGKQPERKASR